MSVSIGSGPAIVVDSGSVTAFDGNPLIFSMRQRDERVALVMTFLSDPDGGELRVSSHWLDDVLRLELWNFEGPDGRGSAAPVLVRALADHLVYLHFRVFRYGNTSDRTVHYTFYEVAKEDVDWTPG